MLLYCYNSLFTFPPCLFPLLVSHPFLSCWCARKSLVSTHARMDAARDTAGWPLRHSRLPSLLGLRWRASQSLRYYRRRSVCVGAYRNRLCSVCVGVYRNRSVACIGLLQCCRCCISGDATMPVPGPSPASLSLDICCLFFSHLVVITRVTFVMSLIF